MKNEKHLFWLSDTNSVHTQRWVRALAEEGFSIVVFGFADVKDDWSAGMPNVCLESGGFRPEFGARNEAGLSKLIYARSLGAIRKIVRQFKPMICHAHYASSYGLMASLAALRPRIVSVWGADVYSTPSRSRLHAYTIRKVLQSADAVLSTSWTMRDQVLKLVNREIDVVPFGIDTDRFAPAPSSGIDGETFTVGSVKTLEAKYGMEYLLRGFAAFRTSRPHEKIRLILVGSGSLMTHLKELAVSLNVAEDVEFAGSVSYDLVPSYHQSLDIAVYPSVLDSESFGVSVIESQACGVPVIVSRVGGLTEVVDEGKTGLVVPPFDSEAIAAAIDRLYSDSNLRRSMGEAGRDRVVNQYSLKSTLDLMLTHYRKYGVR